MPKSAERSMFYGAKPSIFRKAEMLRLNMTIAENKLWKRLNKNQLGVRFKAQHPIDIFIADFYCHKAKLVIEIDGENHKYNEEYDINRTNELEKFGLKIIRFKNKDVINNIEEVVENIKHYLKNRIENTN